MMTKQKDPFVVFGGSDVGAKAKDLVDYRDVLKAYGFLVPQGWVIAAEVFDCLLSELDCGNERSKIMEAILEAEITQEIAQINKQLLDSMSVGVAYAVRSSARSERGGTGIYMTTFFVLTGDRERDEKELWLWEREIYAKEFTREAEDWRKNQDGKVGMSILLQPVVGKRFGEYFCPLLSGSAYTSYRGEPLVRAVVGLGGMAVASANILTFTNAPPPEYFLALINHQDRITVIDLEKNKAVNIPRDWVEIGPTSSQAVMELFGKMEAIAQKEGNFFLEWAVADENTEIAAVQCAPYEDKEAIPIPVNTEGKILVAQGDDIVNHGRRICQHIVYAGYRAWDAKALAILARINSQLENFLLIVPEEGFSFLASSLTMLNRKPSMAITFEHFSNAGALVEKQKGVKVDLDTRVFLYGQGIPVVDHSGGMGGTHFQQLCDRTDILFLGTKFDDDVVLNLEGATSYGHNLKVWDIEVEVINDMTKGEGYVYLAGKPKVVEYTIPQLEEWTTALRDVANDLSGDLANHFYYVHYAIIPYLRNPDGFDPFTIDPENIEIAGGIKKLIESFDIVLEEGGHKVSPYQWEAMQPYLEELQSRLADSNS